MWHSMIQSLLPLQVLVGEPYITPLGFLELSWYCFWGAA